MKRIGDAIWWATMLIPNLFAVLAATVWVWAKMIYLLAARGRGEMNLYHAEFMKAPPWDYKETRKWQAVGAVYFWIVVAIVVW